MGAARRFFLFVILANELVGRDTLASRSTLLVIQIIENI